MTRLTQAQINHLKTKIANKIRAATPTGAQKRQETAYQEYNAAPAAALKATIHKIPVEKLRKLVLATVAPSYSRGNQYHTGNLTTRIQKTTEYKTFGEPVLKAAEEKYNAENKKIQEAQQELRKEGEKLLDRAIFAGSSEEILELIEEFMQK